MLGNTSGETHFRISIVSQAFDGLNTVKRHRMVYAVGLYKLPSMRIVALICRPALKPIMTGNPSWLECCANDQSCHLTVCAASFRS